MKSQTLYRLRQDLTLTSLALDLACSNLAGLCEGQHPNQLRANIFAEVKHQLLRYSPEQLQELYRDAKDPND